MANIIAHAPAKINLYLGVEPRLKDSKHLLTSVFCTVSLADTIVFDFTSSTLRDNQDGLAGKDGQSSQASQDSQSSQASQAFTAQLEIEALPPLDATSLLDQATGTPNFNNTMLRTLDLFKQTHGVAMLPNGTLHVTLIKAIPTQAGLGGGSSDAAAMLRMLCWLAQIDPLSPQNLKIACAVGADVPFFLHAAKAGSCALMDGFGDNLLEQLPVPSLDIVLVKPNAGISTKEAYQAFDNNPQPYADEHPLVKTLQTSPTTLSAIAATCSNNLEPVALALLPQLATIKSDLARQPGVLKAMVSGSGSTVFAICENQDAALGAVEFFSAKNVWAVATKTMRPVESSI